MSVQSCNVMFTLWIRINLYNTLWTGGFPYINTFPMLKHRTTYTEHVCGGQFAFVVIFKV